MATHSSQGKVSLPRAPAAGGQPGAVNELDRLLPLVYSKYKRAKSSQFTAYGLTQPQVAILLLLDKEGPLRVSDIGCALNMVDSNVSNICSRLEKLDMVQRSRQPDDQRVVEISLTDTAQERLRALKAKWGRFRSMMGNQVTWQDFDDICNGLTKLDKLLDLVLATDG